jgi:hypothetical protein
MPLNFILTHSTDGGRRLNNSVMALLGCIHSGANFLNLDVSRDIDNLTGWMGNLDKSNQTIIMLDEYIGPMVDWLQANYETFTKGGLGVVLYQDSGYFWLGSDEYKRKDKELLDLSKREGFPVSKVPITTKPDILMDTVDQMIGRIKPGEGRIRRERE